jgi:hypothetical protein
VGAGQENDRDQCDGHALAHGRSAPKRFGQVGQALLKPVVGLTVSGLARQDFSNSSRIF